MILLQETTLKVDSILFNGFKIKVKHFLNRPEPTNIYSTITTTYKFVVIYTDHPIKRIFCSVISKCLSIN